MSRIVPESEIAGLKSRLAQDSYVTAERLLSEAEADEVAAAL